MTKRTFYLEPGRDGRSVWRVAFDFAASLLAIGPVEILVKPRKITRSEEQNRTFHMLCADIAMSGATWAGKKRTAAQWKVLLVSGHAVATREEVEIIPGLEGEFINIRESTALMSVKRGASLIDYTLAWAAQHDVTVRDPECLKQPQPEDYSDWRKAA